MILLLAKFFCPLDILAFKYVTIVYILILMMLVIWYMNKCHRRTKYLAKFCRFSAIKASITHGISALFILCFSQCLNVSLKLLRGYRLTTRERSDLTVNKKVWLNRNNYNLFQQETFALCSSCFVLLANYRVVPSHFPLSLSSSL